ncbi:polypeptide N-acetylgalactosaminyltransferase 5-like [Babylonia areolata]|uniref:polypeptide N-acetylgalactosaminyltransferase 5-like n=1 Tax=Babylonia areolata TaxID=304850 RepID=UPI003FD4436D
MSPLFKGAWGFKPRLAHNRMFHLYRSRDTVHSITSMVATLYFTPGWLHTPVAEAEREQEHPRGVTEAGYRPLAVSSLVNAVDNDVGLMKIRRTSLYAFWPSKQPTLVINHSHLLFRPSLADRTYQSETHAMRIIRKWMLSLFYFVPVIWFMYVSVELLAERSSSRAAMEMAYRLHQQQNHRLGKDSDILPNALPAEGEAAPGAGAARDMQDLNNLLLDALLRDGHAGGAGGENGPPRGENVHQGLPEDQAFREKLNRFKDYKELLERLRGMERVEVVERVGGVKEEGAGKRVMVEAGGLMKDGGIPVFGVKEVADMAVHQEVGKGEDGVHYPPYVEAWAPNFPGEGGEPVKINTSLLSPEQRRLYDEGWANNSFNQYASDLISVHRSLPDKNPPECQEQRKEYPDHLPEVSVIIIFHNEAWSVLLRSVHSVLSRTPTRLLRQVILVDDLSTMDHLKKPLEVYWRRDSRVSIVRAPRRVGLTQARLLGYQEATADVLVFLDSHIECFPGWAEPLLDRVVKHPGAVPYPDIEIIYDDTFRVGFTNPGARAVFRWKDLTFQWEFVPDYEKARRKNMADLIRSPTMPGGLFAISRQFFDRLGTYDPGLEYWGGENIELSFKAWMCNGSVELIPCSHVGHIFRRSNPIKWTGNIGNKNSVRVAEVWMDDYKNYFYERINYNLGDFGDVTERKLLRQKLGCHDFDWYLKNVFPNMVIPRDMKFAGEVRNVAAGKCLDSMGSPSMQPRLEHCHNLGGNQFWYFTHQGDLYQDSNHVCEKDGGLTQRGSCTNGLWTYRDDRTLQHTRSGKCLSGTAGTEDLSLQPCSDSAWQKWTMTTRPTDRVFP